MLTVLLQWKQSRLSQTVVRRVLVLTWASWILTTGMWSLLLCFGVAMLDRVIASSSSSMAGRNSVPLRVVCDPKPFSNAKPMVLWLKEFLRSLRDSDRKQPGDKKGQVLLKIPTLNSNDLTLWLYSSDCAWRDGQSLRLGWDTMSSTSSGLLCKMAAASLNVTPSKLVLFSEMSLPPGKKKRQNLCYWFMWMF